LKRLSSICIILTIFAFLISACGLSTESPPADASENNEASGFTVYFIDVGQADAALIVCDGKALLIDGGNVADSDLIYTFLKNHEITHLDYIVSTHAHEDHVGGLAGALNYATAGVAYSPVTEFDSRAFGSFLRYLGNQDVSITVPTHGDTFMLGSADVEILGPVNTTDSNHNNLSIVLMITYGETSFLFTGDAEREAEQGILEAGYGLSATVLKVGHHGSNSSTTYPFLYEIMPKYAVISCGRNNQYGHPHDDLLSRLRDAEVTVYRTDMQGTITAVSDGVNVTFSTERNVNAETNPTQTSTEPVVEEYYIGNTKSLKFHRPSCSGLPSEQNSVILETRDDAVNGGYEPCGNCKP